MRRIKKYHKLVLTKGDALDTLTKIKRFKNLRLKDYDINERYYPINKI